VFPLTQLTLITNEFMTLIFVCVIFEQAVQKRMCALHCRNCIYLCCWCFPLSVYFNVCLFTYLFRLYSLFVFIYCLYYVTVLDHFFFESISCSKTRLSYSVCLLIDFYILCCILKNFSKYHMYNLMKL
jgi:hypothetical protein